jgi:hypothetical protein
MEGLQIIEDKKSVPVGSDSAERAVAEVKGAIMIAQMFKRDRAAARERILAECRRPALAESAIYAFPRGGETVTGPSIRLAEAIAQNWGNLQFGIREKEAATGGSIMEAFAWDVETNTRSTKEFLVPHVRYAKGQVKDLVDPRDIYEAVANQGSRRLRACILSIIPGDMVDAAVHECEQAQAAGLGAAGPEVLKNLVAAFEKFGVSKKQIEFRLGHSLDATITAEILALKRVFTAIKDGYSTAEELFQPLEQKADKPSARDEVIAKAAAALKGSDK